MEWPHRQHNCIVSLRASLRLACLDTNIGPVYHSSVYSYTQPLAIAARRQTLDAVNTLQRSTPPILKSNHSNTDIQVPLQLPPTTLKLADIHNHNHITLRKWVLLPITIAQRLGNLKPTSQATPINHKRPLTLSWILFLLVIRRRIMVVMLSSIYVHSSGRLKLGTKN
jgi:hypothetical protein